MRKIICLVFLFNLITACNSSDDPKPIGDKVSAQDLLQDILDAEGQLESFTSCSFEQTIENGVLPSERVISFSCESLDEYSKSINKDDLPLTTDIKNELTAIKLFRQLIQNSLLNQELFDSQFAKGLVAQLSLIDDVIIELTKVTLQIDSKREQLNIEKQLTDIELILKTTSSCEAFVDSRGVYSIDCLNVGISRSNKFKSKSTEAQIKSDIDALNLHNFKLTELKKKYKHIRLISRATRQIDRIEELITLLNEEITQIQDIAANFKEGQERIKSLIKDINSINIYARLSDSENSFSTNKLTQTIPELMKVDSDKASKLLIRSQNLLVILLQTINTTLSFNYELETSTKENYMHFMKKLDFGAKEIEVIYYNYNP